MANKISENLNKIRHKKDYFLKKVAYYADLSINTIGKTEKGANQNSTIETLAKIAKALEVGVDDAIK